ncbi:hypothetical protein BJY52DRAFT_1195020 [Lactarius psammicola]|nr:hypothetical protein BJY52DRAFT_1195020 [Lactarius psammicola]
MFPLPQRRLPLLQPLGWTISLLTPSIAPTFTLYLLRHLKARSPAAKGLPGTAYLFRPSCRLPRSSATTLTRTSPGVSSVKACSLSRRFTRWTQDVLVSGVLVECQSLHLVLLLHSPGVNPSPSNSIPSFAAHVSLLKDTPVVPSPPIAYPFSPEASTSPASLVSPQTPPDVHGPGLVKVA